MGWQAVVAPCVAPDPHTAGMAGLGCQAMLEAVLCRYFRGSCAVSRVFTTRREAWPAHRKRHHQADLEAQHEERLEGHHHLREGTRHAGALAWMVLMAGCPFRHFTSALIISRSIQQSAHPGKTYDDVLRQRRRRSRCCAACSLTCRVPGQLIATSGVQKHFTVQPGQRWGQER